MLPRLLLASLILAPTGARAAYDPLKVEQRTPEFKDLTVKDSKRSREIPIRVYLPKDKTPAAVILLSHGLGGNREGGSFLGKHWSQRGYITVCLQHPGSDDRVFRDKAAGERIAALKQAANAKNLKLRAEDVTAVLDQFETWNKEKSHLLAGRLDLKRVGMAGHSFGAVTTQVTSGQSSRLGKLLTDPRIRAAMPMSPSGPTVGDPKRAFGEVTIPWMLLTGTNDDAKIVGMSDPKERLVVFPALPPGGKYELVLHEAEHSAFTDRPVPGQKRNPNHHRAILAVSTAFWDAYLRDDTDAKKWLDGKEVRSVLEANDRWQKK